MLDPYFSVSQIAQIHYGVITRNKVKHSHRRLLKHTYLGECSFYCYYFLLIIAFFKRLTACSDSSRRNNPLTSSTLSSVLVKEHGALSWQHAVTFRSSVHILVFLADFSYINICLLCSSAESHRRINEHAYIHGAPQLSALPKMGAAANDITGQQRKKKLKTGGGGREGRGICSTT